MPKRDERELQPHVVENESSFEAFRKRFAHFERRVQRTLVALVVVTAVLGTANIYLLDQNSDTHKAVCALHDDLKDRVANSKKFIVEKPELLKQFGYTKKQVEQQIDMQERTIEALEVAGCDD